MQRIMVAPIIRGLVSLFLASLVVAAQTGQPLKQDEYAVVGFIYNDEISALGERALYPIYIQLPADANVKPLVRYLRRYGYPISDPSVCLPGLGSRDYPHGLHIQLLQPQRHSDGTIDVEVRVGDLTLRPGIHFATFLREGAYHFKLNHSGEWQMIGYTKKYGLTDSEARNCEDHKSVSASH